jgi:hypothetical protein
MHMAARAIVASVVTVLVVAPSTLGATPVDGYERRFSHSYGDPREMLDYHFAADYANWFEDDAADALADWSGNNARVPGYHLTSGSGGQVEFRSDSTSPCTGDPTWIACNPPTKDDRTAWKIRVRKLPSSSAPTWMWQEKDDTCADDPDDNYNTTVCFSMHRVIVHESEHNTLTRNHDSQGGIGSTVTVMNGTTPSKNSGSDYWNTHVFLECDEAGAIIAYGMKDFSKPYPTCFGGPEFTGVETEISASGSSFLTCTGSSWAVDVSGRLQVKSASDPYQQLRKTPLQGRPVKIYRKASTSSTWPANPTYTVTASGAWSADNWSRTFESSVTGTWNYKAVYDGAEAVLQPTPSPAAWTIQWITGGPCQL